MLPKGLVLLISIGLAAGVVNLSKKKVLVRELYSLENLTHCDTVCFDKTGTLTEGKLTVEIVFLNIDNKEFEKLMSTYLKYTSDNNSTYIALASYFKQSKNVYECISTVPFASERKYSSVIKKRWANLYNRSTRKTMQKHTVKCCPHNVNRKSCNICGAMQR